MKITPEPIVSVSNSYVPQSVSIDSIFSSNHEWTATLSAEHVTNIITTGDVLPARTVNVKTIEKDNFNWAFEKTADFLKTADITIINLETPLVENCPLRNSGMIFCGDTRHVEGLTFAGVDAVNLANNHINPVCQNINELTIAFLGYNDIGRQTGVSHVDDGTYINDIEAAKDQADIVIASFHWGVEYTHRPTDRQMQIARGAVDAGADLILGNHSHWTQPPEIYNEKLIMYSHGNFIFDQMWSQKTREGIVGKFTFYNNQLIDAELIPIIIDNFGQARFATDTESEYIINAIREEHAQLIPR